MELYETRAIVPLASYGVGVFERKLFPQGNSLLSTLFVKASAGATVLVEYYEATTGEDDGEDTLLEAHTTPAPGLADKIIVNKIHNKPRVRVTITGAAATVGVYATVVSSFASDVGSSLFKDNSTATLALDLGSQGVIYDPILGKHFFARGSSGVQDVNITNVVNFTGTVSTSGLSIAGRISIVPINSVTWTALPAAPLANRNAILVQNQTGVQAKLNYDPSVVGFVGIWINANGEAYREIRDNIVLYAKCASGTIDLVVEELS